MDQIAIIDSGNFVVESGQIARDYTLVLAAQ